MDIRATFHDGETAAPTEVVLRPDRVTRLLNIVGPGGDIRAAWDFADIREIRDHGRFGALVAHIPGHEARLVVTGAEAAENFRAMVPDIRKVQVDHKGLKRVVKWAAGAVGAIGLLIFVIIPALANQLAMWIPPEREVAFGKTVVRQISWFLAEDDAVALCRGEEGTSALNRLAADLAGDADIPYPLNIQVFDHPMVNAFAAPGGQIIIMRGLIDEAETPEEVAAVLAHEIGHVVARDPTRGALRAAGSAGLLGLLFGDVAGGTLIAGVSDHLIQASYTREAEAQADAFAHASLARNGISSHALGDFFERLLAEYGDTDGVLAAFMSHPRLADRIAAAEAADGHDLKGDAMSAADWASVQGMCNGS